MFSWFTSPAAGPFWTWFGVVVDVLVAVGTIGAALAQLMPANWLPRPIRPNEVLHRIGWWATLCLVVGVVLVIPVKWMKDVTEQAEIAERTAPLVERRLTSEQRRTLKTSLTGSGLSIVVTTGSTDAEVATFADDFIGVFREANVLGGTVLGMSMTSRGRSQFPAGVNIGGAEGPAKARLKEAFAAASIPFGEMAIQGIQFGDLSVSIGARPNLFH